MLALFDDTITDIDLSARKDQAAWGADHAQYYPRDDLQDFDGEVAYTRAWIEERWAFLAAR